MSDREEILNDMAWTLRKYYEVQQSTHAITEALNTLPDDRIQDFYESVVLYGFHADDLGKERWLLHFLDRFEDNQLIA